MSNPFTRSITALLRRRSSAQATIEFVKYWDALESLVIRVYRNKSAQADDQTELARLTAWLRKNYPNIQGALAPRWRASRVGSEAPTQDPFASLLAIDSAEAFIDNWDAMRQLPAAREALNQLVVDESGAQDS